jgi:glycosyltransferase involved in cell wall biosynthesis
MKVLNSLLYIRSDIIDYELTAGGSVAHTLGVIKGLLAHNITVYCVSSCMLEALRCLPLSLVVSLSNPKIFASLRWRINCILSNIFFTITLVRFLKGKSIDILYQRYSIFNCSGVLVRLFKKIPLILEYNGSEVWVNKYWGSQIGSMRYNFLRIFFTFTWLAKIIEYINLTYADFIIVVSDVLRDELIARKIPAQKILVNPNGVDPSYLDPAKLLTERYEIRKRYDIEDKFVFGFIGTFSAWHGLSTIEEMIILYKADYHKVHFLLIGDGPLRADLEMRLKHDSHSNSLITFTGMVPQDQARNYLAACDAFLCPTEHNPDGSRFFGSPTKLFEYMSMAKPIIASDLEQIADIISPALKVFSAQEFSSQACGLLVEPSQKESYYRAAKRIVESSDYERKILGKNARTRVMHNFTWNIHVQNIIRFVTTSARREE